MIKMQTLVLTADELETLKRALDLLHATLGRELHDVPDAQEAMRNGYLREMAQVRQLRGTVGRAEG